jgi:hypothetical protein
MIQFFCDESAEAGMRGAFVDQGGLFSYIAPEAHGDRGAAGRSDTYLLLVEGRSASDRVDRPAVVAERDSHLFLAPTGGQKNKPRRIRAVEAEGY